jgi:cobalt-zinc-cadmium efflux system protein
MVTDAAALGLALLAQIISRRPASAKHSFGFGRIQVLAAMLNALAMLLVVVWINFEAIGRLIQPAPVNAQSVIIVASIGLAINLLVAWILSRDSENLNMRAALIHVLGDLLGSVAAIIAGLVISFTGWMQIDPLLSILVTLLILRSTIAILRDAYHFLMAGVPQHIDFRQVEQDLAAIDGVILIHDLHVWETTPGRSTLIAHVEIRDLAEWPRILLSIQTMLARAHQIEHITLQAETATMAHQPNCATVNVNVDVDVNVDANADAPDAHRAPH